MCFLKKAKDDGKENFTQAAMKLFNYFPKTAWRRKFSGFNTLNRTDCIIRVEPKYCSNGPYVRVLHTKPNYRCEKPIKL